MKKFSVILLLIAALLSGLWAQEGFRVSGKVTANSQYGEYPVSEGTVILSQEGTVMHKTSVTVDYSSQSSLYSFEAVSPGEYTIVFHGILYGSTYSSTGTITVSDSDVEENILADPDPTHCFLSLNFQFREQNSYYSTPLDSVKVTCVSDGGGAPEVGYSDQYGGLKFFCDTATVYTISASKSGYKDTTFQTRAWGKDEYAYAPGPLYLTVSMQEDLGVQVSVSGQVSLGDENIRVLNSEKLMLTSSWGKDYTSDITFTGYSFPEVSVGSARFWVKDINTGEESLNLRVKMPETGSVDIQETEGGFEQDVELERIGVTLAGMAVERSSGRPVPDIRVWQEGGKDTVTIDYSGLYSFPGTKEGSVRIWAGGNGMNTVSVESEVLFSKVNTATGQIIVGDTLKLDYVETDIVFYGQVYYMDPSTYAYVYLEDAKISVFDESGLSKLGDTVSDASGNFELSFRGYMNTSYKLKITHPKIEDCEFSATAYSVRTSVYPSLTMRGPEKYTVESPKASRIGDSLAVLLSWDYPQALYDSIEHADYDIMTLVINKKVNTLDVTSQSGGTVVWVANLDPDAVTKLPATTWVDTAVDADSVYFYQFDIRYYTPNGVASTEWTDSVMVSLKNRYSLSLDVNDTAYGSVHGAGIYESGTVVEITAEPKAGYVFVAWTNGSDTVSSESRFDWTVLCDTSFTALFVPESVPEVFYTLELSALPAEGGEVKGAGEYEAGTEVEISATAATGYVFVAWMQGTDTVSRDSEYRFTLVSDTAFAALFTEEVSNGKSEAFAWNCYAGNGCIILTGNGEPASWRVFTIEGRLLRRGTMSSTRTEITVPVSGLYVVEYSGTSGRDIRKVVVSIR